MNFHRTETYLAIPMTRRVAALAATLGLALLQGCATPMGAAFTGPAAVTADQANVYLYRQSKFQAGGQSFTVQLDQQPTEELANASFIHKQLASGEHTLTVKPGAMGKTYEHRWTAEAGKTYYLEFVLPAFILANAFNLGSEISVRDELTAQREMKELRGMKQ